MKNTHLIPTDKPSVLILRQDGKLFFTGYGGQLGKVHGLIKDVPQHIYITSDEEIKIDDYYLGDDNHIYCLVTTVNSNGKKIILTTDQDLIADGIQAIDDEFLEWFVKNPSCENVEVQKWFDGVDFLEYKIIIPKEEPCLFCEGTGQVVSSTTISGFKTCDCINIPQEEPKYITVKEPCSLCDGTGETTFSGTYTTQRKCDLCNGEKYWNKKILVEEPKQYTSEELEGFEDFKKLIKPKQESLEEAAEEFYPPTTTDLICSPKLVRDAFIAGVKWQTERSYSEEEVCDILFKLTEFFWGHTERMSSREWFGQFKKK